MYIYMLCIYHHLMYIYIYRILILPTPLLYNYLDTLIPFPATLPLTFLLSMHLNTHSFFEGRDYCDLC